MHANRRTGTHNLIFLKFATVRDSGHKTRAIEATDCCEDKIENDARQPQGKVANCTVSAPAVSPSSGGTQNGQPVPFKTQRVV